MTHGPPTLSAEGWQAGLTRAIAGNRKRTDLVGIGNPLRGDDAVGLEIAARLRSKLGSSPVRGIGIHEASSRPERLLSGLAASGGRILIFDSVEAAKEPGEIVFSGLGDTKYGFFATHNIPLKLVPGMAGRMDDVFIVGVQPASVEVREGLSDVVSESADRVVAAVARALEEIA